MVFFRTQGRPHLLAAAEVADRVDARVAAMFVLLERSAGVLSESEYRGIVEEFEGVMVPVRAARSELDAALDGGAGEEVFATLEGRLSSLDDGLAPVQEALSRYADATRLCEETSGHLVAEISRLEREAVTAGEDARCAEVAAWARGELSAAAVAAQGRNWLAAHRLLSQALDRTRAAAGEINAAVSVVDDRRAKVTRLSESAERLRVRGTAGVSVYEKLRAVSAPDSEAQRPALLTAGRLYKEIVAAVGALNADIGNPDHDVDALLARAEVAENDLEAAIATMERSLAAGPPSGATQNFTEGASL